jgi:hypothetical protein
MANIEDIDYLRQNSEINYKNLLIDSSYRNLSIHPYSSYYSINLEYPIYNVVNIKIDQAFVPNAVTTIHPYNKTFLFKSGFTCNKRDRLKHTVNLKIKDYNIYDMINHVTSGSYNINSLLSDYEITTGNYLFSDIYNSDLNFVKFTSPLPFILDMENSTSRRSFGFNEYTENKYDLDLYPDKVEHGLYKLDHDSSNRVFLSYPTNNYNSTTYVITKSTLDDSYAKIDSNKDSVDVLESTDTKSVMTNGVDVDGIFTFYIRNNIVEYLNNYYSDISANITETADTYVLSSGSTVFQTISLLSTYETPIKNPADSSKTYVQILRKIRALLDSSHWDTGTPLSLSNNDVTWEIYECSDYTTTGGNFTSYHQCSPFTNHINGNNIIDDMYRLSNLSSNSYSNPSDFDDINTTLNGLVSGSSLTVGYLVIINNNKSYHINEINNSASTPYIKLQDIITTTSYTTYTVSEFINNITELTICSTKDAQIYSLASGNMTTENESGISSYTGLTDAKYLITQKTTYDGSVLLDNDPTEYIGKIIWASSGDNSVTTSTSPSINTKEIAYKSNIFFCIAITNNTNSNITLTSCRLSSGSLTNDKFIYSSLPLSSSQNEILKLSYVASTYNMATDYTKIPKLHYENHMLVSPNVSSLVGSKYMKLRCEEIENLVDDTNFASGNFSPGLALFNTVAITKIYNNVATNFHSINYKNFHPIGKLTRLTFKFEDDNGNQIDFKGLEHHFTLLVSYLTPIKKTTFTKSILNPNYDGNFIEYLRYKEEREEKLNEHNLVNPQKFLNKEIAIIKEFEEEFNQFIEKSKADNNYFNDNSLNYDNNIILNNDSDEDDQDDEDDEDEDDNEDVEYYDTNETDNE